MITIDGKQYENVSNTFSEDDYNILVTYKIDGEPSPPLYTRRGAAKRNILDFLADQDGTIENIQLWRLLARVE